MKLVSAGASLHCHCRRRVVSHKIAQLPTTFFVVGDVVLKNFTLLSDAADFVIGVVNVDSEIIHL